MSEAMRLCDRLEVYAAVADDRVILQMTPEEARVFARCLRDWDALGQTFAREELLSKLRVGFDDWSEKVQMIAICVMMSAIAADLACRFADAVFRVAP